MYCCKPLHTTISYFFALLFMVFPLLCFAAPVAGTGTSAKESLSLTPQEADEPEIDETEEDEEEEQEIPEEAELPLRINKITVVGNKIVPLEAILDRIPYHVGELYDPNKSRRLINNLYHDLRRFKNVSLYGQKKGSDLINLFIAVEEKPMLIAATFEGNTQVTEKEIREKVDFSTIPALDDAELKRYALAINKIYKDKGYHRTEIEPTLIIDENNKATAHFKITEHKKAVVRRINFIGNQHFSGKALRGVIFTREDWLVSFLDKSGTFQVDRIDADKHMIEQFYQNHGYLNAKIVDTHIEINEITNDVFITHEIQEGEQYRISQVKAFGNDIIKDDYLTSLLPIKPGDVYSREKIVDSIKNLEFVWGDFGYVYTHIDPSIQPDEDTHTVNISFFSDTGSRVFLNKLTIKGNRKTRDKIIRRNISIEEGGLITNRQMDATKNRVESLGYFDQRDGVNWKMTRIDENTADLDLLIKEAKTGSAHLKLGFGGSAASIKSVAKSVTVEGNVADSNLFGSGIKVNVNGKFGLEEQTILFNVTQPWLFDKPIYGSMDVFHKRVGYDEFVLTRPVNEKHSGGLLTSGFIIGPWHRIAAESYLRFSLGVDDIRYESRANSDPLATTPRASFNLPDKAEQLIAQTSYNSILAKLFDPGTFVTWTTMLGKDTRNHPMHPTRGHSWFARSLFAIPSFNNNIGFHKFDFDVNWYTPLIGDFDLILRLHAYVGMINPFGSKFVPYRELFHIGGPASVRGFLYGQIGPQFCVRREGDLLCDSIGGTKTFYLNAELIFPITNDFSMKGVVFYDGGAGWDNPYACSVPERFILNNRFHYRHAVGAGFRILNPMPIRVDWGFKLDPRKGESAYEVHFGMNYDW